MYYLFLEFKYRCFYLMFSFLLTLLMSYYFQKSILYCIGKPFLELHQKFIFIDLTEAFYTTLSICSIISICLLIPFLVYHLWCYFLPSWYFSERKSINNLVCILLILLCIEIFLIYIYIFPFVCEFLLSFESKKSGLIVIQLSARIQSYVSLYIKFFLLVLTLFQIPFLFLVFFYKNICSGYDLCKNRKITLFLLLFLSAGISPPDIVSQLILTTILWGLYEFLIFLGFIFQVKPRKDNF